MDVQLVFSSSIGLVEPNVAVDMALSRTAMSQTGVTDESGTRSGTTTCAAGGRRGGMNVMREIVEA